MHARNELLPNPLRPALARLHTSNIQENVYTSRIAYKNPSIIKWTDPKQL